MILTKLLEEIDSYYAHLQVPIEQNGVALTEALSKREIILARSSELLGETQFILDKRRGELAEKFQDLKADVFKDVVNGESALERKAVKIAEKLNKTVADQTRSLITRLSWLKEDSRGHRG